MFQNGLRVFGLCLMFFFSSASEASLLSRTGMGRIIAQNDIDSDQFEEAYDESEDYTPPTAAPPGRFNRFNRTNLPPPEGVEGQFGGGDQREERSDMPPSQFSGGGGGASNARFGNSDGKIQFKLVEPQDLDNPKNPREPGYEMYKSYSNYKKALKP